MRAVAPFLPRGALAACGVTAGVLWAEAPRAEAWVYVAAATAAVAASATLAEAVRRGGWVGGALSPAGAVAGILLVLFALRPAALAADPGNATPGLADLGFDNADLVVATSVGVLGLVCLAAPFIALLPPRAYAREARVDAAGTAAAVALVALAAVGTALWARLFVHAGGFGALAHNPAQLHLRQFGGIYGTFGLLLCLTAPLVGLLAYLSTGSRPMLAAAAVSGLLGAIGSVLLASRGPLVAAVLAGLILVAGRLSRTQVAGVALVAVLLALALAYAGAIREEAQAESLDRAAEDALHRNPLDVLGGNQVELDHLVALVELVPGRLDWLRGRSIAYVPAAFVPRSVWPGKPLPIDYRLSRRLYGSDARAGTPFTLSGELFWNFGAAGVTLGMAALGLLAGLGWRVLALSRRREAPLVAALVVGCSYFLLTRPLAPMLQMTVVAVVALLAAYASARIASGRALRGRPAEPQQPPDE